MKKGYDTYIFHHILNITKYKQRILSCSKIYSNTVEIINFFNYVYAFMCFESIHSCMKTFKQFQKLKKKISSFLYCYAINNKSNKQ